MDFILIAVFALLGSMLTFFSGFGLGTILTPIFILFFPIDISIALTAVVHFLNNCFKLLLIGKHLNYKVSLYFGSAGVISALAGAYTLSLFSTDNILYSYSWGQNTINVPLLHFIIGILFIIFSILEIIPDGKQKLAIKNATLLIGGSISGFFGGLSGHQGALRSIFLLKYGLTKESFIATGVVIACFIDISRISIYSTQFYNDINLEVVPLLAIAVGSAFAGAMIGKRFLKKITIRFMNIIVGVLISIMGLLMILGII
jgi:uncharacterized membrane protein YfcA